MISFSPEIVRIILASLHANETLAKYATVSKQWQHIVESFTFRTIQIQDQEEYATFWANLSSSHRRCSLTRLDWNFTLPETKARKKNRGGPNLPGGANLQLKEVEAFTADVRELLEGLQSWEEENVAVKGAKELTIQITARSNSKIVASVPRLGSPVSILGDIPASSIKRAVGFYATSSSQRAFDGASILRIAGAFANLVHLHLNIFDGDRCDAEKRQIRRYDTAMQLKVLDVNHLTWLKLDIVHTATADESFAIPSAILPSEPTVDHLSEILQNISRSPSLLRMYVTGFAVISAALFWPPVLINSGLSWPSLEWLEIEFDMKTPNGDWYFLLGDLSIDAKENDDEHEEDYESEDEYGDDDDDDDDEDNDEEDDDDDGENRRVIHEFGEHPYKPLRNIPDGRKLYPLFTAVARAAATMKNLKYLSVRTKFSDPSRTFCEVWFVSPGTSCWHDRKFITQKIGLNDIESTWRLYWNVIGLAPEEEFLDIWKRTAVDRGIDLEVHVIS